MRSQFCHAVDLLPTILDVCDAEAPRFIDGHEQLSIDGRSLKDTFTSVDAPSPRPTQYFEMVGSRSIYHDGWKATTDHVGPTPALERSLIPGSHRFEDDHWALFNLDDDFAEARDVSREHPKIVDDLVTRWHAEAERNSVFPLDDTLWGRASAAPTPEPPPRLAGMMSLESPAPMRSPVLDFDQRQFLRADWVRLVGGGVSVRSNFAAPRGDR